MSAFVAITHMTGETVLVERASISAVLEWARFNNMQYVGREGELRAGFPTFHVKAADGSPLTDGALADLRGAQWRHTTFDSGRTNGHEFPGCGVFAQLLRF